VSREESPRFHDVIKAFEGLTGCGLIINTSFNVRGEPIVCTPEDAYRCFMRTEMDYLVLESFLLDKRSSPSGKRMPIGGAITFSTETARKLAREEGR